MNDGAALYAGLPWWAKLLLLFLLATILFSFNPRAATVATFSLLLLTLFRVWS